MSSELHLRLMTQADLPFADTLRALAGWNQKIQHWEQLLAWDPQGCFVAEWKGTLTGTVTTTRFENDLAWIGMLLVHPDHRGRGIGKALLQRALDHLSDVASVKLDATPLGQPLYEKLGFKAEWALTRWETKGIDPNDARLTDVSRGEVPSRLSLSEPQNAPDAGRPAKSSCFVRTMKEGDLAAITPMDTQAFGASRKKMIEHWARFHLASLVSGSETTGIQGYGLLRDGFKACYLGPVVATTEVAGIFLIEALIAQAGGRPIYWDIPGDNVAAVAAAQRFGFTPQRHLLRMFLGKNETPGIPRQFFAIADPSIG